MVVYYPSTCIAGDKKIKSSEEKVDKNSFKDNMKNSPERGKYLRRKMDIEKQMRDTERIKAKKGMEPSVAEPDPTDVPLPTF